MKKLSVIMCVYNTAPFLEKSLSSILNQTFSNFEFIIVNDSSTDESMNIINRFKNRFDNIKIIDNEKNMGTSYCRNIALDISEGEYISFIDSDDYVPNDYFEKMFLPLEKNDADLSLCDIRVEYEENNWFELKKSCVGSVNSINIVNTGFSASACNKIFKKKVLTKYSFSEGKISEDLAVILPAIVNSLNVIYIEDTYYCYIQRRNSVQNSSFSDKKFDAFYGVELTLNRISGCIDYHNLEQAIVYNQLITLLFYSLCNEKSFFRRLKFLKKYSKLIQKYDILNNVYYIDFLSSLGKKHRLYYSVLVKLCIIRFCLMANIWIQLYKLLKKIFDKYVIKENIKINDLIIAAKRNSKLKERKKSISAVIPNYNYSRFLYQRIYSVLNQKIKISEIIILDDCSNDDSRDVIDQIVSRLKKYISIRKIYNKENSGSAFKQWALGFSTSKSDYVWIAEADDYCNQNFLKTLYKYLENNVSLAYTNTSFIDKNGKVITKSIINLIDLMNTGHWNKSYIFNGEDEFNKYTFLNCTISNVSSCLIKRDDYCDILKTCGDYHQAGDWLFYSYLMHSGMVAYSKKRCNYYRVHGGNVSSVYDKKKHLDEIKNVHDYFKKNYGLNSFQMERIADRYNYLKDVWGIK